MYSSYNEQTYPGEEYPGNGLNAAKLYETLKPYRDPFLWRARHCAELSDRTLFAEPGSLNNESTEDGYQSTGARGVDYLNSSLLLALFPPNIEVVRLEADPVVVRLASGSKRAKGQLDEALAIFSEKIADEVDTIGLRGPMALSIRRILVGGNSLFYLGKKGLPRDIPLDCYVQERDAYGRILIIVVCEELPERTLPARAREALERSGKNSQKSYVYIENGKSHDRGIGTAKKTHQLYTVIKARPLQEEWDNIIYDVHQEIDDVYIPGSYGGPYDEHNVPFMSFGYEWVGNEHYAHSRVERYAGHLNSLESLTEMIVEGTAVNTKMLLLCNPAGVTDPDDLVDSENGDIISGNADDVKALQTDKAQDLAFAASVRTELNNQISSDFGLTMQASPTRDRVTAEEIKVLASQLDRGLGGIYSHFSNTIQRPTFNRIMYRIESRGEAPVVPIHKNNKQALKARIVTGLEALGRGNDADRLQMFTNDLVQLGAAVKQMPIPVIRIRDTAGKMALARGLNPEEILEDEEVLAELQQQQQQQAALNSPLAVEATRQLGNAASAQSEAV